METLNKEELVEKYGRYVYSKAQKYARIADVDDLYQQGMLGLVNACKGFDQNQGNTFLTYADTFITGSIFKYLRDNNLIKIDRKLITLNRKADQVADMITQKLQRPPTTFELACYLEVPEERLVDAKIATDFVMSLDQEADSTGEKEISLHDQIPYIEPGYNDDIAALRMAIGELPEQDRLLITSRFYNDMSQSETGKVLKMTQVQVSRRETKVLATLNSKIAC